MAVGRVGRGEAVFHAQQLPLAGGQLLKPVLFEAVVGIDLEDQSVLAVVAEERMTVGLRPIGSAAVPALAVEDEHAAGRRNQPEKRASHPSPPAVRPSRSYASRARCGWRRSRV